MYIERLFAVTTFVMLPMKHTVWPVHSDNEKTFFPPIIVIQQSKANEKMEKVNSFIS
jgi:hypothetical protein